MSGSSIKREFFQWIISLDQVILSDYRDKKFLNLLIDNFEDIIPIGTVGGLRAKNISDLIVKHKANLSAAQINLSNQEIVKRWKQN